MGYSVSWLAVRGKDASTVRKQLALSATGDREEVPESPFLGADLQNGWYLVFANDSTFSVNAPLASLSRASEIVTCSVEEHVMCSFASGWRDGQEVWSILHDSERGLDHLDAEGVLPSLFPAIYRHFLEQQKQGGADYIFDVPVEVAKAIAGFRHDENIDHPTGEPFEVLIP